MAGTDWARVINGSLEKATPHTRGIFGRAGRIMSVDELLDFFDKSRMAVASTVSPSGAPHSACVGFIVVDGRFYIRLAPEATIHRNLRRDPRIAVTVVEPPFTINVLMQGSVLFPSEESEDTRNARAAFRAKFSHDPEILAEVIPSRVFALKS